MRTILAPLLLLASLRPAGAAAEGVDYLRDVKPILSRKCVACHGVLKQKSGLRVDTAARLFRGGNGGPAVEPGKSAESPLVDVITAAGGLRMPPEGEGEALSPAEVGVITAWIDAGAKAPGHEPEPPDPRDHWAFRPPVRPPLPAVKDAAWVANPVDAFLAAGHEARGVVPVGPAEKGVLLRRVHLDLTGIAPTPGEVRAYLDDPAEDAYEKAVDRLLSSPRHGERWGRHWMDVWRYSDWDGFGAEVRESRPHVWRWRDWIVESLNEDKGYDRMVVEMLAADEAAPGDASALRATGFLARNWYKFSRNVWLDNTVEHTSKAFLGLTVNCARCHDHKYDPVSQKDYYRFRAIFEPIDVRSDRVAGQPDVAKDGVSSVFDAKADVKTFLFVRGNEKDPDASRPVGPGVPAVFGGGAMKVAPVALPRETWAPGLRGFVREETLAAARAEVKATADAVAKAARGTPAAALSEKTLAAARAGLTAAEARVAAEGARHADPPRPDAALLARLAAMAERQAAYLKAEDVFARAEAAVPPKGAPAGKAADAGKAKVKAGLAALEAARAALAKADADYTPLGPTYPATSTGRRLALARWVTSRENPLAARVAVNHVWMRHFGVPLVPTVADFGNNGKPPTHPELLDWLAVDFMESGWSLKALHRRVVTSRAYRMRSTGEDSGAGGTNLALDPGNVSFWRQNPKRMEAEAVRDNVLAAAGTLDPAMGGPDLDPASGETAPRRSLYFRHAKEKRVMFLKLFDSPSVVSCYRRGESVVPQQALALVNSTLGLEQARVLGRALSLDVPDDARFVDAAFARVLSRGPTAGERAECLGFLSEESRSLTPAAPETPGERARADLVHVLFNHNDFVTVR